MSLIRLKVFLLADECRAMQFASWVQMGLSFPRYLSDTLLNFSCFGLASSHTKAYATTMTTLTVTAQLTYMLLFYQTLRMHQKLNKTAGNARSNNRFEEFA